MSGHSGPTTRQMAAKRSIKTQTLPRSEKPAKSRKKAATLTDPSISVSSDTSSGPDIGVSSREEGNVSHCVSYA